MKCNDHELKKKAHNEYRDICRRKRALWLESRLHEIEHVLHQDKSNMWFVVDKLIGCGSTQSPLVSSERLRLHFCKAFNVDGASADTLEPQAEPKIPSKSFSHDAPYVSKSEVLASKCQL